MEHKAASSTSKPLLKVGLIINPVAGMGGSVGLKGTDHLVEEAVRRGAVPKANARAALALEALRPLAETIQIYTYAGEMGGRLCTELGFAVTVLGQPANPPRAEDTKALAQQLAQQGMDLILFAGGDGTARDVFEAVGISTVAIGIPAGVKIHSPVYTKKPQDAGQLASRFLTGKISRTIEAEVLDIDEALYRNNVLSTRLYGYLQIPLERGSTQNRKAATPLSETAAIGSIAYQIVDHMEEDTVYLIGAGSTTAGIMQMLGLKNTLIGVDLVCNRQLIANDLYGDQILEQIRGKRAKMILTVTGGQGFLFGRGNQQITPEVIQEIGRENITIVATQAKLYSLRGQPLLTDTSDPALDEALSGYWRVVTSYGETMICQVR